MSHYKIRLSIGILAILALIGAIYLGDLRDVAFDLCIGFLVGVILWLLVVVYPDRKKRRILKNNLSNDYKNFRESVVKILLEILQEQVSSEESIKNLTEHEEFYAYFKDRHNDILNGMMDCAHVDQPLLKELRILHNNVEYVLNNVEIMDAALLKNLRQLSRAVYIHENCTLHQDDVEYLGNFIFQILAGWSMKDGKQQEDYIQELIDKI